MACTRPRPVAWCGGGTRPRAPSFGPGDFIDNSALGTYFLII